ncbi:hypothetical protein HHL16_11095 [Pseudoflavitalea sp. G-6-1-2]|uniref:hypothetical protein n=1 Tax=Pseudoflavitalea sp. G-6-1-2 TaxID=2728841 RepID=UPI00146BA2FA|nr:hypothetical protein [Pseudoflavitalea sp. G-6-1-2]NML21424.1 hypothetical protein [Pseudoflavitalea sp. G-6-1-2]
MSKNLFLLCCLFVTQHGFSQSLDFTALLDSGKAEFKRQAVADSPDFSNAYSLLSQAVKKQPGNTEGRYFLAHVIDRINSSDGKEMYLSKKRLTIEASQHLEAINKLTPSYSGEMWLLDPYSKISAIWSGQAMAYLYAGKSDSAIYAFREGRQRGGFINPVLDYNRHLLNSCQKNAFLISSGDMVTFPLLYLQSIEKLRPDVTIIDCNLLNTAWYVRYLNQKQHLKLSYNNNDIDTLVYKEWTPTEVSLADPDNPGNGIKWTLRPTYGERYVLKSDLMLLDILKQNLHSRPLHYTTGPDTTSSLFLDSFLQPDGLLFTLVRNDADLARLVEAAPGKLQTYSIEKINDEDIRKSQDAVFLLNEYRRAYLTCIAYIHSRSQFANAMKLMNEMDRKFNVNKLPWSSEQQQQYSDQLRETIRKQL